VRLRPLSEAECYARCYGGRSEERVSFVRVMARSERRPTLSGEHLRKLFEVRLESREAEEAA
jgi:hypothetical protein